MTSSFSGFWLVDCDLMQHAVRWGVITAIACTVRRSVQYVYYATWPHLPGSQRTPDMMLPVADCQSVCWPLTLMPDWLSYSEKMIESVTIYSPSIVNLSPRGDVTAFLWPQAQPDTVKDHLWSRGWITQHLTFYNNRQTEQYILNLYIPVLLALQRLKDIKGLHFRKFQLTRFGHLKDKGEGNSKIYTFLFWHKIAKVYTTFRGSWGSFNMSVCCDQTHLQNRKHQSVSAGRTQRLSQRIRSQYLF